VFSNSVPKRGQRFDDSNPTNWTAQKSLSLYFEQKKKKNKVANPNFTVIIPLAICSNLVTDLDHFEALPAHQTDPQIFKPACKYCACHSTYYVAFYQFFFFM
jgi:hypothetical protein